MLTNYRSMLIKYRAMIRLHRLLYFILSLLLFITNFKTNGLPYSRLAMHRDDIDEEGSPRESAGQGLAIETLLQILHVTWPEID